ncbi:hypothetical protein AVEN_275590-1 [Araneus ventricosus]|uniref:Uncharacterized protein n=1 Tax=Araneus ventricosus TaxID=182803 RepID=A0A4Y2KEY1_ARAVE|nr:hypothetical protein AVEN_275590-1 [Araneus ventricosus]
MSCLIYQSAEFYRHYYTFPTTIDIEVLKDVPFKKPAVTFCYKATIGRSKFCADHPHLCERPENLPEFCRRHSHYCKGDLLSLVIPKFGYFTNYSKETEETARELLIESQDVPSAFFNQSVSITYVEDPDINAFAKCYSKHLHLYSDDEEDEKATTLINLNIFPEDVIYNFKIELPESELFYPWERTQVYAAVHSPYIPFNPIYDGIGIRPGYDYYIDVKLASSQFSKKGESLLRLSLEPLGQPDEEGLHQRQTCVLVHVHLEHQFGLFSYTLSSTTPSLFKGSLIRRHAENRAGKLPEAVLGLRRTDDEQITEEPCDAASEEPNSFDPLASTTSRIPGISEC